jgi:hypothetical protein
MGEGNPAALQLAKTVEGPAWERAEDASAGAKSPKGSWSSVAVRKDGVAPRDHVFLFYSGREARIN